MLGKIQTLNTSKLIEIATSEETELCRIMNVNGSDKGNGHRHNYTKLYSWLLSERRNEKLNILDIGIGSVNPSMTSNMYGCLNYKPGASQRGWKDYFPNSMIYGCDIDRDIINFDDDRIKGFYIDQTDVHGIIQTFYVGELRDVKFDVIIDDGLHAFDVNWQLMKLLLPKLNPGGIYIIEDLFDFNQSKTSNLMGYHWQYVQLPNPHNTFDNNLILACNSTEALIENPSPK